MAFIEGVSVEELNVFYRICPYPSWKSPIFSDDKFALMMFCLRSFKKAFKNVSYKITFVLDSCPSFYREEMGRLIKVKKTFFEGEKMGNEGSYLKQLELAAQLEDEEKVYFAEDDYLYLPQAGRKLLEALDVFDFVTLYDHPDYYFEPHLSARQEVRLWANHHWVSRVSTCLTFGTKAKFLKDKKELMTEFGVRDYQMWCELTKKSQLYSPIPSLATHLVRGLIAPNVNWGEIKQWREF